MSDPNEPTEDASADAASTTAPAAEPAQGAPSAETASGGDAEIDATTAATADESTSEEAGGDAASEAAPSDERDADPEHAARIAALFTRTGPDGSSGFHFARWGGPIRVRAIGLDPTGAELAARVFAEAAALVGRAAAEDDEGAPNVVICVVPEWRELSAAPGIGSIVEDPKTLAAELEADGRDEHRLVDLSDEDGVRRMAILIRAGERVRSSAGQAYILGVVARSLLFFAEDAFADDSPIAVRRSGRGVLKTWFERLLKAAYADDAPNATRDPALAEALAAATKGDERSGDRRRGRRGRRRSGEESGVAETSTDAGDDFAVDAMDGAPS